MKTLFKIYEELYKAGVKVYSYNLCDTPAVTIEANKQYAIFFNPNAIHSLADETCIAAHEAGHMKKKPAAGQYNMLYLTKNIYTHCITEFAKCGIWRNTFV